MVERMKPTRGKILIKVVKKEPHEVSGIYIPESAAESKEIIQGSVLAVGEGNFVDGKVMTPDIRPGDTVLFKYFTGYYIDTSRYYMIVDEKDILSVIEKE